MSPSIAKLAVTPPVVGFVITLIYKSPASSCFAIAADVFAICISEIIPSCILAPPEAVNIISGSLFCVAYSIILVILSPTALPILPIIKLLSIIAVATFFEFIFPTPQSTPSSKSDFCSAFFNFSSYPGNSNGFVTFIS